MLDGKVILVTGSSRGIGREIILQCARNKAHVVINYNKSESKALELMEEVKKYHVKVLAVKADVGNAHEVLLMFKRINEEFGRLDVLVNNAGILKDQLLLFTKESDFDELVNINFKGSFNCMQHAAKMMIKQKKGNIINFSSIVARLGNSGKIAYAGTKAAIIGMTLSAAKELGNFGIRVNAIAPGLIDTEMNSYIKPEKLFKILESTHLKSIGKPIDVANLVVFLASDQSIYITGQVIGVDGGLII